MEEENRRLKFQFDLLIKTLNRTSHKRKEIDGDESMSVKKRKLADETLHEKKINALMSDMGQELLDRFISCKKSEINKLRPIIAAFVGRHSRDTMNRLIGETNKVTRWQWKHATIQS